MAAVARRGLLLIEIFVSLAILCACAGLMLAAASGLSDNPDRAVAEEANALAMWLSDKISEARLEGGTFVIQVANTNAGNAGLNFRWKGDMTDKPQDIFLSSSAVIRNEEASMAFTYDGQWQTMTPAMMFTVRPLPGKKAAMRAVTVSGAGYVRVRKK